MADEHTITETNRGCLTDSKHRQGTGLHATNNDESREIGHFSEVLAWLDHLADKGETSQ